MSKRSLSVEASSVALKKRQIDSSHENAPIIHSVPKNMLPIIHPPLKVNDFFTDLETQVNDKEVDEKIQKIVQSFPPPPLPNYITQKYSNGIMIPFIYPPPPKFEQKDGTENFITLPPLPFPPRNYMPYPLVSDNASLTPHEVFDAFLEASNNLPRIDMVLASAAGSLTDMKSQAKSEGFTITEHENNKKKHKPVTEVVVVKEPVKPIKRRRGRPSKNSYKEVVEVKIKEEEAEVKGGIDQANNSNTSNNNHSEYAKASDGVNNDNRGTEYDNYKEFVEQVDMSMEHDQFHSERNVYELTRRGKKNYCKVNYLFSDVKNDTSGENSIKIDKEDNELTLNNASKKSISIPFNTSKVFANGDIQPKEISSANGLYKQKRIDDLAKNIKLLDDFEQSNKTTIYNSLKQHYLERLKNLKNTQLSFGVKDEDIRDEQLLRDKLSLEETRDDELVRLKLFANYELLNNAMIFYRDSNKVYKNMNQIMFNKLNKLKNFFEFQKKVFLKAIENDNEASMFDVKTKDATRLYASISTRDIGSFLKDTVKSSMSSTPLGSFSDTNNNQEKDSTMSVPSDILNLSEEDIIKAAVGKMPPPTSLVHDFIPLVSQSEFNIITGDLPKYKNGGNGSDSNSSSVKGTGAHNLKHQIFSSSLYDPITSGSDTNSETSSSATPKRRGRRAANPPPGPGDKLIDNGDKNNSKYSEALLLARIMKHYIPPMGAKPEELNEDLEGLGIKTRWPVNK